MHMRLAAFIIRIVRAIQVNANGARANGGADPGLWAEMTRSMRGLMQQKGGEKQQRKGGDQNEEENKERRRAEAADAIARMLRRLLSELYEQMVRGRNIRLSLSASVVQDYGVIHERLRFLKERLLFVPPYQQQLMDPAAALPRTTACLVSLLRRQLLRRLPVDKAEYAQFWRDLRDRRLPALYRLHRELVLHTLVHCASVRHAPELLDLDAPWLLLVARRKLLPTPLTEEAIDSLRRELHDDEDEDRDYTAAAGGERRRLIMERLRAIIAVNRAVHDCVFPELAHYVAQFLLTTTTTATEAAETTSRTHVDI